MNKSKLYASGVSAAALLMLLLAAKSADAITKKLQVNVPETSVYLEPEERSPAIAVLHSGDIVSLASTRMFRKQWYYIYFKAPGSTVLKSGYVLIEAVRPMYRVTRVITINEEKSESASRESSDSPGICWGMPSSEIRRRAGQPSDQESRDGLLILCYTGRAWERSCHVGYIFEDDRLAGTRYRFVTEGGCLAEYRRLKSILCDRFGLPEEDLAQWRPGSSQEEESQWEKAVHSGDLACLSSWKTEESRIRLSLNRVDSGVSLSVEMTEHDRGGIENPGL